MKQEERTRGEEWWKDRGKVGMEKEFELRRIRLAVVVRFERGEGDWRGSKEGRIEGGRQERVRIRARLRFAWNRLWRYRVEDGRELSQQLSAQLAGFISIGTICRAK